MPDEILMQRKEAYSGRIMLQRTFISKEEKRTPEFKEGRDRPALLFCANAGGL